jgi:4-hydroxysphinganine ceramide fatty acyl 2-hydroxylase
LHVLTIIPLFFVGVFLWSAIEYGIHRFIFHYPFKSKAGQRFHFICHGIHHTDPRDPLRLVMPPSVSVPLAFMFYFLFSWSVGPLHTLALFPGFAAAYLFYDLNHFAFHHFSFRNRWWRKMQKHHILHHYQADSAGYGVSSKLWDTIFGTHFKNKKSI